MYKLLFILFIITKGKLQATSNFNLPLIITLDFCIYRPSLFYIIHECSSAYIGYEPLIVPVTLPLFVVSVVSCAGLYTVVAIYIY